MTRTSRYLATAVMLISAGCANVELSTSPSGAAVPFVRLRSEPYSYTYYSGFTESARLVVRDAAHWSTVWAQIHATVSPLPARPEVDFSREMIIVAAMGGRNSGGFGILIDDATAIGLDGVAVTVRSIAPGSRCLVTGALTAPVDVARLPRRTGVVQFTERTQVRDCE